MKEFIVALAVGGVPEKPDFTYSEFQIIEANTKEDAVKIYNNKNNCSYWYGECLGLREEVDINNYSRKKSIKEKPMEPFKHNGNLLLKNKALMHLVNNKEFMEWLESNHKIYFYQNAKQYLPIDEEESFWLSGGHDLNVTKVSEDIIFMLAYIFDQKDGEIKIDEIKHWTAIQFKQKNKGE